MGAVELFKLGQMVTQMLSVIADGVEKLDDLDGAEEAQAKRMLQDLQVSNKALTDRVLAKLRS